jgi:hypothetical protein
VLKLVVRIITTRLKVAKHSQGREMSEGMYVVGVSPPYYVPVFVPFIPSLVVSYPCSDLGALYGHTVLHMQSASVHRTVVNGFKSITFENPSVPGCGRNLSLESDRKFRDAPKILFNWTYSVLSQYSDSLRAGRCGDRITVETRFSTPVQTGPGAHPAYYIMGTGSFSRG